MHAVLTACADTPGGVIPVAALVSQRVQAGEDRLVVKASLSRTLRRLWRIGLVEAEFGARAELGGPPALWRPRPS